MARRTVEDFNGFVAARRPAVPKKSVASASTPSRAKAATLAATANIRKAARPKNDPAPQPPHAKKREKIPNNIKHKEVTIMKQKENKMVNRVEQIIETKHNDQSIVECSSDVSDNQDYEDDFEDYESDFESDTSVESSPRLEPPSQHVEAKQSILNHAGPKFALPVCVEEKLEPFLDEKFEINSLEKIIEMGLNNFKTAGKRKREQEAKEKLQIRGNVLMEMIKLDTVSYSLLDLPAIPYEQYIKMYGRSNMTQVQTQTRDDSAEKEIQTNEIDLVDKWTQRPMILINELDCFSPDYLNVDRPSGQKLYDSQKNIHHGLRLVLIRYPVILLRRSAAGGHRLVRTATVDPERVSAAGRNMLMILEQQMMGQVERRLVANKNDMGFSAGHLSPAISAVEFLANCPVTSVEFARITSSIESVATTHEVMGSCYNIEYVICIWNTSNMENPEYVLKCPNRITSFCAIPKMNGGLVTTAHVDGSICVWDLRESKSCHQQMDGIPYSVRSPSFHTAISVNQGHRSKIVALRVVTYNSASRANEQLPEELCSLDEDFLLTVWVVMDNWIDGPEITEHRCAGTAPLSSVRLVKTQTIEAIKNIPRYLSDGVAATCMCLNNNQDAIIGTNSRLAFRCNLGGHEVWPKYYTYDDIGEHISINWLDICPFDMKYFLASFSSNEVMLYRTSRRDALRRFFTSSSTPKTSTALVKAQWCSGFPGIVFGLDSLSGIHVWDVRSDVTVPTMSVPSRRKDAITSMSLTSTRKHQNTFAGLTFADGEVELHLIKLDSWTAATSAVDDGVEHYGQLSDFLASL